jgi:hypothetical protein
MPGQLRATSPVHPIDEIRRTPVIMASQPPHIQVPRPSSSTTLRVLALVAGAVLIATGHAAPHEATAYVTPFLLAR